MACNALELEFYFKLFKRHTEELFLLINERNVLLFMFILKSYIVGYIKLQTTGGMR